jgi:hypothetical protein
MRNKGMILDSDRYVDRIFRFHIADASSWLDQSPLLVLSYLQPVHLRVEILPVVRRDRKTEPAAGH